MLLFSLVLLGTGCSVLDKPNENYEETNKNEWKVVDKGLASMFPSKQGNMEVVYRGSGNYEHRQTLKSVYDFDGTRYVKYEGHVNGGDKINLNERRLVIDYLISNREVKESILNLDQNQPEKTNRLHSIIPNLIVLQKPLEIGHSWTQLFHYEPDNPDSSKIGNKKSVEEKNEHDRKGVHSEETPYQAVTTITEIESNKGKPVITTETIVKGLPDYNGHIYKEKKKWEFGKGLVYFEHNTPSSIANPFSVFQLMQMNEKKK